MKNFLRARILNKCERLLCEDALNIVRNFEIEHINDFNALRTTILKLYKFNMLLETKRSAAK